MGLGRSDGDEGGGAVVKQRGEGVGFSAAMQRRLLSMSRAEGGLTSYFLLINNLLIRL